MNKPAPLTDETVLRLWSGDAPRPVLGSNKVLAFAQAIIAARDAQWEQMLTAPQQEHTCYPWGVCNCKAQPVAQPVNQMLLEALKECAAVCAGETMSKSGLVHALELARAAIKAAEAA